MLRVRSLYGIATLGALMVFVLANGDGKLPFPEPEMPLEVAVSDGDPFPKAGFFSDKMTLAELDYILSRANLEIETPETEENDNSKDDSSCGVSLDDAEYLALTIESEAGNVKNHNGRVAVGLTVCYRTDSDQYPDTARGVVEQPYQYTDLVSRYSEESYSAAVTAITLWEEGNSESILPEECMYFFGDGKENWFYRKKSGGGIEIVPVPGQTVTAEVYEAYQRIVEKKSPAKTEVADEASAASDVADEVTDEASALSDVADEVTDEAGAVSDVADEVTDEAVEERVENEEQTDTIGENPAEENVTDENGTEVPLLEGVPTDI